MSKSLYSGVNKVYFRSYLLLNIVASSAARQKGKPGKGFVKTNHFKAYPLINYYRN
jgi:hypothetical protein